MTDVVASRSGSILADGHTIAWEYFGAADREVVCLLNGLAMQTPAWYGFLPRFQPDYDVLLWDYPGQGKSSTLDVPYFIDAIASYLVRILDELAIARVHLVGISYGGFVALEFARQFQERLHTLTVSGILLSREALFDMYQDISLRFYAAGKEMFDLYTRYMYEKIFSERFVRQAGESLEKMRRNFHDRYSGRITALVRLTEAQDPFFAKLEERMPQYRAIATPSLVIAAGDDRVVSPKVQRKIAATLPHCRYEVIPDCGHVAYIEEPDRFFPLVRQLMEHHRTGSVKTLLLTAN